MWAVYCFLSKKNETGNVSFANTTIEYWDRIRNGMAELADRGVEWDRIRGVVQDHQSALIRYAASILGGTEQAKDIVQEVLLKLCRQRWRDV